MEEMEVPIEQAQEDIHHQAHHSGERWIGWVALSSALLAALAAVAALAAGHRANEAQLIQLKASDKWNEYQAKKQKSLAVESRDTLLEALGKPVPQADRQYLERHGEEEKELRAKAEEFEKESGQNNRAHVPLSYGVTMFQVAIAIGAISALSRRPPFWYVSLCFGVAGIAFLVWGFTVR